MKCSAHRHRDIPNVPVSGDDVRVPDAVIEWFDVATQSFRPICDDCRALVNAGPAPTHPIERAAFDAVARNFRPLRDA